MPDQRSQRAELLARHLDGQLSGEDTAAVETLLRDSPEARAQLEALRRIDASLTSTFRAAATPTTLDPSVARALPARRSPIAIIRTIAAVILVAALAGWFLWPQGQWPKHSAVPRTVDVFYDREVARGFVPDAVCTDDAQFRAFTESKLGTALQADADPGVEILGWGYPRDADAMGLPAGTVSLLCRVDSDDDVLVLLAPSGAGIAPRSQWLMGHSVFRQDLGTVTLVEISRLKAPRVLPLIRNVPCPERRHDPAD